MTSQEYATRKTAGTINLVANSDGTFTVTSSTFNPLTGAGTDVIEQITLESVQSEANQLQILLNNANAFIADLQALPVQTEPPITPPVS